MIENQPAKRSIPISLTLVASIGLLVTVAVSIVFWVQWSTARLNTNELVVQRANLYADQILKDIAIQLDPALHQLEFIATRIESGEIDISDGPLFETSLMSSLAAAPQVFSIAFIDNNLQTVSARRDQNGTVRLVRFDRRGNKQMADAFDQTRAAKEGFWGDIVFVDGFTLVNRRRPLRRNGEFVGILATVISVTKVSELIEDFAKPLGGTGFVLYGRERVLAHPTLKRASPYQTADNPLLTLNQIDDKILNTLGLQLSDRENRGTPFADRFERREVTLDGDKFVTFIHWIDTYGETPWGVGTWLKFHDVDIAKRRVLDAGYIGVCVILVSLVAAMIVGRSIARPIEKLTKNTTKIGAFELSEIDKLPPSWIKELDEQAGAFNAMLAGLKSFETYIPKSLVSRLIHEGGAGAVESQEKELTVMFTDIVGFTSMSEGQPAKSVAGMVNDHFAILGACVENENGTIDKYIGDALMAFWGAPEDQPDTAERACRAAISMKLALESDNIKRLENGLPPIRIRIGIHQGLVLVGNIGAPGRVNYTIIGDTVNTCQRIESLGKQFDVGEDATILISGVVARLVKTEFNVELAGDFEVKGKEEKVEIHRLKT